MLTDEYISSFEKEIDNIEQKISNGVSNIENDIPLASEDTKNRYSSYKYGRPALEIIKQYKNAIQNKADKDTITKLIEEIKFNYNKMITFSQVFERDFEQDGIVRIVQPIAKPNTQRDPKIVKVIEKANKIHSELSELTQLLDDIGYSGDIINIKQLVSSAQKNLADAITQLAKQTQLTRQGGNRKSKKRRKSNRRRKSNKRRKSNRRR